MHGVNVCVAIGAKDKVLAGWAVPLQRPQPTDLPCSSRCCRVGLENLIEAASLVARAYDRQSHHLLLCSLT